MIHDKECMFCGKTVRYWPNYSPRTSADFGNIEWVQRRNVKQYFHRSCYLDTTRGRRNRLGKDI